MHILQQRLYILCLLSVFTFSESFGKGSILYQEHGEGSDRMQISSDVQTEHDPGTYSIEDVSDVLQPYIGRLNPYKGELELAFKNYMETQHAASICEEIEETPLRYVNRNVYKLQKMTTANQPAELEIFVNAYKNAVNSGIRYGDIHEKLQSVIVILDSHLGSVLANEITKIISIYYTVEPLTLSDAIGNVIADVDMDDVNANSEPLSLKQVQTAYRNLIKSNANILLQHIFGMPSDAYSKILEEKFRGSFLRDTDFEHCDRTEQIAMVLLYLGHIVLSQQIDMNFGTIYALAHDHLDYFGEILRSIMIQEVKTFLPELKLVDRIKGTRNLIKKEEIGDLIDFIPILKIISEQLKNSFKNSRSLNSITATIFISVKEWFMNELLLVIHHFKSHVIHGTPIPTSTNPFVKKVYGVLNPHGVKTFRLSNGAAVESSRQPRVITGYPYTQAFAPTGDGSSMNGVSQGSLHTNSVLIGPNTRSPTTMREVSMK